MKAKAIVRGEFNYITPILLFILVVGGWALYAFIPGYYSSAKVSGILGDAIIRHHRESDEVVKEEVIKALSSFSEYELTPEDISILRDEKSPVINATVHYIYVIRIPFTQKRIDLNMEAKAYKDFTLSNSLN